MQFKPILISDKATFDRYLSSRIYRNMTYNFTSLFIWQDWEPYTWAESSGAIIIKNHYYYLDSVLAPISSEDNCILKATEDIISWYKEQKKLFVMTGVTPLHLEIFEKAWPDRFDVRELPDEANYIYRSSDLADLKGSNYRTKRNHIHRFKREYPDYQFLPLSTSLIPQCKENLNLWVKDHDPKDLNIQGEYLGIDLAFDNFGDLDYLGACLLVGGKVIAFTLGEVLDHETMCIHVEKADTAYHGSFATINQLFADQFCRKYPYINRAEDMGLKGLRIAKESYHPCRMEKVYQLRLREELDQWNLD